MTRYRLTPKAQDDLSEIWDRTNEKWGREQAERYLRDIQRAVERFAQSPSLARRSDDIRPGYRRFRVGAHVVFFRQGEEAIEIVRILHGHMDFTRHL